MKKIFLTLLIITINLFSLDIKDFGLTESLNNNLNSTYVSLYIKDSPVMYNINLFELEQITGSDTIDIPLKTDKISKKQFKKLDQEKTQGHLIHSDLYFTSEIFKIKNDAILKYYLKVDIEKKRQEIPGIELQKTKIHIFSNLIDAVSGDYLSEIDYRIIDEKNLDEYCNDFKINKKLGNELNNKYAYIKTDLFIENDTATVLYHKYNSTIRHSLVIDSLGNYSYAKAKRLYNILPEFIKLYADSIFPITKEPLSKDLLVIKYPDSVKKVIKSTWKLHIKPNGDTVHIYEPINAGISYFLFDEMNFYPNNIRKNINAVIVSDTEREVLITLSNEEYEMVFYDIWELQKGRNAKRIQPEIKSGKYKLSVYDLNNNYLIFEKIIYKIQMQ